MLYLSISWGQWKLMQMVREVLGAAQPSCQCPWMTSTTTSQSLASPTTRAPLWKMLQTSPPFSGFMWVSSFHLWFCPPTSLSLTAPTTWAPLWKILPTSPPFSGFLWVGSFHLPIFDSVPHPHPRPPTSPAPNFDRIVSMLNMVTYWKNNLSSTRKSYHGGHEAPVQCGGSCH